MLCHASSFSSAALLKQEKEEIVKTIFQHWIILFGLSNQILSGNGGEFKKKLLKEISDQLNLFARSTADESP